MTAGRYRIGIDVGGTFTDCVLIDEQTGTVSTVKVPTTPSDQSEGFISAVDRCQVPLSDAELVLHGCTVGLNAILTRRGARIALLTTDGFRDVVAFGRGQRPGSDQFNPRYRRSFGDGRQPFVPRYLRRPVDERISSRGEVLVPLNVEQLRAEIEFLAGQDVEGIAICFVNAYINDTHERQAKRLVEEFLPSVHCWTSTEVHPCFKEYPRFSTCVLNTYIGPLLDRYLDRTESLLHQRDYRGSLLMMQSNGGVLTAGMTRQRPAYTVQSGPTGGVIAAAYWGKRLEADRLITLDIGGTSADYSIVQHGQPLVTTELEIEHDVVVALPAVNVHSIGAGGGSIAWVDHLGALRVGPQSSGAVPGPACYGRGGTEPTVTDALVVTGILRPQDFLGGELTLHADRAREAVSAVAQRLGTSVEEAGEAVLDIAVANVVEGAREMSVYNGVDPRGYTLYAFGSAGPVFASRIGRELGVENVAIPPTPGEMCAYGLAMADLRVDLGEPLVKLVDAVSPQELDALYSSLEARALEILADRGIDSNGADAPVLLRWLDGRYQGQTWETPSVPVPAGRISEQAVAELRRNFHDTHRRLWGYALQQAAIKASMVRVTALAPFSKGEPSPLPEGDRNSQRARTADAQLFTASSWQDVPIFRRELLQPGDCVYGPALINQRTSTTVLSAGDQASVDRYGHIWITWK